LLLRVFFAIIGSLFIAALSQIAFFFPWNRDVPNTFQTLGVLLVGNLYGKWLGPFTVILYLLEGLGLPFFADKSHGYIYLKGPTAGYFFGFILAAFITGFLAERGFDRAYILTWRSTFVEMVIADLSIYLIGIPVLWGYLGWKIAWLDGFAVFLIGDAIKIMIAVLLLPSLWKLLARIFDLPDEYSYKGYMAINSNIAK